MKYSRDLKRTFAEANENRFVISPNIFSRYAYLLEDELTTRMRLMIKRHPFLINTRLPSKQTALHVAAQQRNVNRMEMLLDMGFDMNEICTVRNIKTYKKRIVVPLIWAAFGYDNGPFHVEAFNLLLLRGADVNLFKKHVNSCFLSRLPEYVAIQLRALTEINKMEERIMQCRSSLITFVLCCKRTKLIHPDVGRFNIARDLLWPTRREFVWHKQSQNKSKNLNPKTT